MRTELETLIWGSEWFTRALRCVREERIPDAWVGAGALRDLVWGELYGPGFRPDEVRDVDVALINLKQQLVNLPRDQRRSSDDSCRRRIRDRAVRRP